VTSCTDAAPPAAYRGVTEPSKKDTEMLRFILNLFAPRGLEPRPTDLPMSDRDLAPLRLHFMPHS
jgi:hypothetical protein